MTGVQVNSIVIAGGGAAGAAVAAAVAVSLKGSGTKITLIHPPDDGSNAPCEAIRGGVHSFHQLLGVDEQLVIDRTHGVFGLGTRYRGFRTDHEDVFLPLGSHGMTLHLVNFHHYAAKLKAAGNGEEYNEYSLSAAAAEHGLFRPPDDDDSPVSKTLAYDIYVDPDRYAMFFRECAENLGVTVLAEKMDGADIGEEGFIESVVLDGGDRVDGDFFIDCSSERLLASCLSAESSFDDWSRWLPCDRFVSVLTKKKNQPVLFMDINANDYGWIQKTTLSNLTAHSFACCSRHIDDSSAQQLLEKKLDGVAVGDIQTKKHRAGSYRKHWVKNCVAIGPAALSLEPMEISALHLVQSAVLRLLSMLPDKKLNVALAEEYNRVTSAEHASVRDYLILHYVLSGRRNSPFWAQFGDSALPDSLRTRIELFKTHGRITGRDHEFLSEARWASAFLNFGLWPSSYDPIADMVDEKRMRRNVSQFREKIQKTVESF